MSFINRFKDATIGFSGYVRLLRDPAGGFGYLSLMLLIVLAISCVIQTVNTRQDLAFMADQARKAPYFELRNGQVRFEGQQPYVVSEDGSTIIVDTTGKTGPDAIAGKPNSLLITRDTLYQVDAVGRTQSTPFSQLAGITITRDDIAGFVGGIWWIIPIGYIFLYGLQLGFKALDAVILGLVGMIYGSAAGREVPFGLGFKAGLYAMTLSIIMQWIIPGYTTIPWSAGTWLHGGLGFLIWWGVSILFTVMGLRAYFKEEPNYYYNP